MKSSKKADMLTKFYREKSRGYYGKLVDRFELSESNMKIASIKNFIKALPDNIKKFKLEQNRDEKNRWHYRGHYANGEHDAYIFYLQKPKMAYYPDLEIKADTTEEKRAYIDGFKNTESRLKDGGFI